MKILGTTALALAFAFGWGGGSLLFEATTPSQAEVSAPVDIWQVLCPYDQTWPNSYYAAPGTVGQAICFDI